MFYCFHNRYRCLCSFSLVSSASLSLVWIISCPHTLTIVVSLDLSLSLPMSVHVEQYNNNNNNDAEFSPPCAFILMIFNLMLSITCLSASWFFVDRVTDDGLFIIAPIRLFDSRACSIIVFTAQDTRGCQLTEKKAGRHRGTPSLKTIRRHQHTSFGAYRWTIMFV